MAEANLKESGKDFFRDHNAKSYLFLGSAMCAMDKIPGKLLPNLLEYFFAIGTTHGNFQAVTKAAPRLFLSVNSRLRMTEPLAFHFEVFIRE